jgi:protease-4
MMFTRRHPYLFFFLLMTAMGTVSMVFVSIMAMALSGEEARYGGDKVGVIEVTGAITDSREILDQLKDFREEESIKAIVLRVDSPGGAVGPSQEIYREIRKTSTVKKVIVSMGSVAASGGYYVAAAGDGIVANPGTITGSIGVIMGYTNFEELMAKIGLTPVVIKSAEFKDIGSPMRKMTRQEKTLLEDLAKGIHRQFVADIAEARQLETAKVQAIADGRIFTGEDAKTLGLVDRLGNLQDALEWAAELGGIEGDVETVYPEKERLSFLQYLMESALHSWNKNMLTSRLRPDALLR